MDVETEGVMDGVGLLLALREAEAVGDCVMELVGVREGVAVEERVGLREADGGGELEGVTEGVFVLDGVVHCLWPG